MSDKDHIVIVDDDADVRETVEDYLNLHGYRVTALDGGEALRRQIDSGPRFDLAILDITMPGEDGLSLAKFLRARGGIKIIMLTASSDTIDRIVGLELGADDYLPKPAEMRELLARVKAVLRRRGDTGEQPKGLAGQPARVAFGRCQLDLAVRTLLSETGEEIPLTAMEFDLLKAFAEHPNRALNRDQLLEMAYSRSWNPFDRSLDVRIARLRRKVEFDPKKPRVIKTIRGVGYAFSPSE